MILIIGAYGQTGRLLVEQLAAKQATRAMVRHAAQADLLQALGAEVVIADLTQDLSAALTGVDAVIFAAGAGMQGSPEQIDHVGAVRLMDAMQQHNISRFIMITSVGTPYPEKMPPMLYPYLLAKQKAEAYLRTTSLHWTVVRPAGLNNHPPTGCVAMAQVGPAMSSISRADVAACCIELLDQSASYGLAIEIMGGTIPIATAMAQATGQPT